MYLYNIREFQKLVPVRFKNFYLNFLIGLYLDTTKNKKNVQEFTLKICILLLLLIDYEIDFEIKSTHMLYSRIF